MKIVVGFLLCISLAILVSPKLYASEKVVIAYYSGSIQKLDSFDARGFTHLIYCFGHLQDHKLTLHKPQDTLLIQKMVSLKKRNNKLKVLVSLGGWGGCAPCSEGFSTASGRSEFANSVLALITNLKIDGIDLDWEYPAIEGVPGHRFSPDDKPNFTELIRTLRQVLGKERIITFAAGGSDSYLNNSVDWNSVMPLVDYVNLMTYDFYGGYSKTTGHHTALFSTSNQNQSTDHCVKSLIGKGIDQRKLIIGAAFYGRIWKGVSAQDHGLYQSGKFKTYVSYKDISIALSEKAGYTQYWDSVAKAPYAYNATAKTFATFDNKQSIEAKTDYVNQNNLGGIMFWQLGDDKPKHGLIEVINKTLK